MMIRILTLIAFCVALNPAMAKVPVKKIKISIKRTELMAQLKNMTKLTNEARAVPYLAGGTITGYKFVEIKKGSYILKGGILPGDIVTQINGEPASNIPKLLVFLSQIKTVKSADVLIDRKGSGIGIHYDIH